MEEEACIVGRIKLLSGGDWKLRRQRGTSLGFHAYEPDPEVLRRSERPHPTLHSPGSANRGKKVPFQDKELADQSLLLFTTQPAVASAPQKPVPPPSPHHQPIDRFLRGLGQPRGLYDVEAKLVEYISVFTIREANNDEVPNPVLGRLRFYLQPRQGRQAMRRTTIGVVL